MIRRSEETAPRCSIARCRNYSSYRARYRLAPDAPWIDSSFFYCDAHAEAMSDALCRNDTELVQYLPADSSGSDSDSTAESESE